MHLTLRELQYLENDYSVKSLGTVVVCALVTDTLLHSAGLCLLKSLETRVVDSLSFSGLVTFTVTDTSEVSCHRHPFSAVFQDGNPNICQHVYKSLKLFLFQE